MEKIDEFNENNKEWVTYREENEYENLKEIIKRNAHKSGLESGIKQGMKQGVKQGMKQGMDKGMKQGITKEKHNIATNMLNMKLDIDIIKQATGLSEQAILDLK